MLLHRTTTHVQLYLVFSVYVECIFYVMEMMNSLVLQDVGLSILESYSRVMKGLAFNILARTDDILYVDGAVKLQQAAAGSASPYAHGRLGSGFPKQVQISPGLSSISKEPSASFSMRAMSYLHAVPVSTGQRTPYPLRRNLGQPMKRMAVIS